MIGGILPWVFSPLLFHNEMSVLLIFLMGANMIAGLSDPAGADRMAAAALHYAL